MDAARAWLALCALLAVGALAAQALPADRLDWQPALAAHQPWRAFTAAFVHWTGLHLAANLAGLAVLALLGAVARLPAPAALAWALAWPATQAALVGWPALQRYGGLSGVLHAGVAVAVLWLVAARPGRGGPTPARRRAVGAAIGAGLLAKLLLEGPWGPLLRPGPGFPVVPLAHACGALTGLMAAALVLAARRDVSVRGRA